jgi:hypothetical protein
LYARKNSRIGNRSNRNFMIYVNRTREVVARLGLKREE